jgi:hypothetical protein
LGLELAESLYGSAADDRLSSNGSTCRWGDRRYGHVKVI